MTLQSERISLVIKGQFNPAIFQPAWFAANNLVREPEANAAEIGLIHPELTQIDMDWLKLSISRTRFEATTAQSAYFQPLRDLVLGIFGLLSHTPLSALGINQIFDHSMDGEEFDQLVEKLIKQAFWNAILDDARMQVLSMQSERQGSYPGATRLTLEPSQKLQEMGSFGLTININHHFQLDRSNSLSPGKLLQDVLNTQWMSSLEKGLSISHSVLR